MTKTQQSSMSKHLESVARKNSFLEGRNLTAEPSSGWPAICLERDGRHFRLSFWGVCVTLQIWRFYHKADFLVFVIFVFGGCERLTIRVSNELWLSLLCLGLIYKQINKVKNSCHSTYSAGASRNENIMAGRSGFISAHIFIMSNPGFCKTK